MRTPSTLIAALCLTVVPMSARAEDFAAGSLIIPMDTDYQDLGMLRAYGLVYALLQADVPVRWMIKTGKAQGEADFTASATDVLSGMAIVEHGYRGGPWVVDAADAGAAMPVIEAWQADNQDTAVHEATEGFTGDVSRTLVVAPTISMMADGNQKIARKYMLAAGIPDSTGDLNWPDSSPDMLDPDELSGPTEEDHRDGALFDEDGDPLYCQFMSMHWGVGDAEQNPEVVAEMRRFLSHPTHLFAECQAVNAFENLDPHGYFLTSKGFEIGDKVMTYDFYETDTPFAQIDGQFLGVGGSEPAYTLPPGEQYKASDIVMITEKDTPIGVNDVWMTGFLDGVCPANSTGCLTAGKVSYLGGHEYDVDLPMSEHPTTQGTRLFLNSLFEAPCATEEGLPLIELTKDAPEVTEAPEVTFTITYSNAGAMPAFSAVLTDTLPSGVTFVSATDDGAFADGAVTWDLGNLGPGEGSTVQVMVTLDAPGVYVNQAALAYRAGTNMLSADSNATMTAYGVVTSGSSGGEAGSSEGTGIGEVGTGSAEGGSSGPQPTTGGGGEAGGSTSAAEGSSGGESVGETAPEGCGCRGTDGGSGSGLVVVMTAFGLVRRRRAQGVRRARAEFAGSETDGAVS
jgi:uncharacterized repeat protein (TIGR01451 family)